MATVSSFLACFNQCLVLSGSESVFPTFLVMDVPSEAAPRVEALFPEAAGF